MSQIGNFGSKIVFSVSDSTVMTFNSFSRTVKGKWTEHPGIGTKPASEYIGADLDTVSLTIILSASLGVSPRKIIETMESLCKNGSTNYLVVGNARVGSGKFYIESMSETWDEIFTHGELYQATLNISFKEYGN